MTRCSIREMIQKILELKKARIAFKTCKEGLPRGGDGKALRTGELEKQMSRKLWNGKEKKWRTHDAVEKWKPWFSSRAARERNSDGSRAQRQEVLLDGAVRTQRGTTSNQRCELTRKYRHILTIKQQKHHLTEWFKVYQN